MRAMLYGDMEHLLEQASPSFHRGFGRGCAMQVDPRRTHSWPLLTRFGAGMTTPYQLVLSDFTLGNFRSFLPVSPAGACRHWVSRRCSEKVRWEPP